MITAANGNLLEADVDALVNTVNTVGVMGKGIALQFKRAYPQMYKDYASACKRGEVHLGKMHVWPTGQMAGPRFIINFPTKGHWKSRSRLPDIQTGLLDLVRVVDEQGITSIAVPPLGCGHGGLNWAQVEPVIRERLDVLEGVDVQLFAPEGAPSAAAMKTSGPAPAMSAGRAALIELMARYSTHALGDPSLIEIQKLMYFLQMAGEDLKLNYVAHHYGPYADNLRHVLVQLEGHYVCGFGDGSTAVEQAEPLVLLPGARETALAELATHPATIEHIGRVITLIEGFESAYAVELLATVHWVLVHSDEALDDEAVIATVRQWSPRKGGMFTPDHVRTALGALRERGWTPELSNAH